MCSCWCRITDDFAVVFVAGESPTVRDLLTRERDGVAFWVDDIVVVGREQIAPDLMAFARKYPWFDDDDVTPAALLTMTSPLFFSRLFRLLRVFDLSLVMVLSLRCTTEVDSMMRPLEVERMDWLWRYNTDCSDPSPRASISRSLIGWYRRETPGSADRITLPSSAPLYSDSDEVLPDDSDSISSLSLSRSSSPFARRASFSVLRCSSRNRSTIVSWKLWSQADWGGLLLRLRSLLWLWRHLCVPPQCNLEWASRDRDRLLLLCDVCSDFLYKSFSLSLPGIWR